MVESALTREAFARAYESGAALDEDGLFRLLRTVVEADVAASEDGARA